MPVITRQVKEFWDQDPCLFPRILASLKKTASQEVLDQVFQDAGITAQEGREALARAVLAWESIRMIAPERYPWSRVFESKEAERAAIAARGEEYLANCADPEKR